MILEGRDGEITDAIADGKNTYGMQTFDQHLLELYKAGTITKEEALEKSSKRNDLDLMIKNADLEKKQQAHLAAGKDINAGLESEVVKLKEI